MTEAAATNPAAEPPRPSAFLEELSRTLPPENVTIGELVERIGARGMLLFSMVMTVPFLLPVSIPGSSVPLGLLIALIGVGLVVDRAPWLPKALMRRRIPSPRLALVLQKGARLFERLERLTRPRLAPLTRGRTMTRVNGVLLAISGLLLTSPLPFPFTNTLPGWASLLYSVGIMERDGLAVIGGHAFFVATVVYFVFLGWGTWWALDAFVRYVQGG